jgi:hypothetical protein
MNVIEKEGGKVVSSGYKVIKADVVNPIKRKYGNPRRYVRPYLADGVAEWDFGDVRMTLTAPWVSEDMYLTYEHTPTAREVEKNDQEVFDEEIAKRSTKGL